MRRGLHAVTDETTIAEASLADIDDEIRRCLHGYETGGTSQGRKAFYQRLVWLEKIRAATHGVPAKRRRFNDA